MWHRLDHRVGCSSQATTAAVDKSQSASHTEIRTLPERPAAQRHRRPHEALPRLRRQPDDQNAHRGALRLGQDDWPHPPDRLSRAQTCRPAIQAHHDGEQRHPNGPSAERGAARSNDMRPKNEPQALHTAVRDASHATRTQVCASTQLASVASLGPSLPNSTAC